MHPSIARGAVEAFTAPGDAVVDPFCGSGTVLVEAMGLGRRALGVDASPLGVAIARARTTLLGEAGRATCDADAEALHAVRGRLDALVDALSARGDTTARWPVHGALIVNLRNILDAMDEVAAANPMRPPPVPLRLGRPGRGRVAPSQP